MFIAVYLDFESCQTFTISPTCSVRNIASIAATDEASHNFTQVCYNLFYAIMHVTMLILHFFVSVATQVDPIVIRSVKVQTVKVKSSVVNRVSAGQKNENIFQSVT